MTPTAQRPGCPLNRQRADAAGIGIVDGTGVMLANRAKLAWYASAGPQQLDTVARPAFGANAFRRFFTETNGLNTFNTLFGVAVTLFCFQCHFSNQKVGVWGWSSRASRVALSLNLFDGCAALHINWIKIQSVKMD